MKKLHFILNFTKAKFESLSVRKFIILLLFGSALSCTEKLNDSVADINPSVNQYVSPTGNIGYYYLDGIPVSIEKFADEWKGSCPGEPLFFANDRMSSGMFI